MKRPNRTGVLDYIWYVLRTSICVEVGPTIDLNRTAVGHSFVHWVDDSMREVTLDEAFHLLIISVFLLNFNL